MIGSGFTASGGRWNLQASCVSASGGFSAGPSTRIAAAVTYLGKGGLLRRDETGSITGEYSYSTGALMTGASHSLTPWLRGGISFGLSWENIDSGSGTGITASAGLAADVTERGTAALSITGAGSPPEWNGITKDMPTSINLGGSWRFNSILSTFAGGGIGLSTSSSFGGGLTLALEDISFTGGYRFTMDQDETTGFFAGVRYTYESAGTYIIEASVSQRDQLEWPVLAGISILL